MIFISHRGNLEGPNSEWENSPDRISFVLSKCYDVQIDVWFEKGEFWLGHNEAQYPINEDFLETIGIWCHAKTITTFERLLRNSKIHCFYRETDSVALTSQGFLWTYPGKELTKKSIAAMPEMFLDWNDLYRGYGICSDNILLYETEYYNLKNK